MTDSENLRPKGGGGRFPRQNRAESDDSSRTDTRRLGEAEFAALLESAARLQRAVPDAVLVGGSAAVLHAGHRFSYDHDHVVQGLQDRYDAVLGAVEVLEGWKIDDNVSSPPLTILGELDGVQAGLRNLRRSRPLEVEEIVLPSGSTLRIPTVDEALRVKAFLVARRQWVRDYVDTAALAEHAGLERSARVLADIDEYYDPLKDREPVRTLIERSLADPQPRDTRTIARLSEYKGLNPRWAEWDRVRKQCMDLAIAIGRRERPRGVQ